VYVLKNKILFIVSLILVVTLFSGCSSNNNQSNSKEVDNSISTSEEEEVVQTLESIDVVTPAGSPTLSGVKMFHDTKELEGTKINYTMTLTTDELSAKLLAGEADFAVVPTNLAAKLYNKGVGYTLVAPVVWGNLYLISSEEINNYEDLKGKEIYTIGQGLTPDILLRYLLKQNNIDVENDVKLTYLSGGSELASNFISGKSAITVMPEPMLTIINSKNISYNLTMDLQKEWNKINGSEYGYPQASLIVKTDLLEENRNFVLNFVEEFKKSVEWLESEPEKAGDYYKELNDSMESDITAKSIPGSNIKYKSAEDAEGEIEKYLEILNEYDGDSIGGKLPDEGFYLK
jgi:NitT/TauT family transport system substrate-binding protein